MTMQSGTLRILEAHFSPPQALALAEAIEFELNGAELVTVPLMDARFSGVDAKFASVDARFSELRRELAAMETRLTNRMLGIGGVATGVVVTLMVFLAKR